MTFSTGVFNPEPYLQRHLTAIGATRDERQAAERCRVEVRRGPFCSRPTRSIPYSNLDHHRMGSHVTTLLLA